MPYPHIPGSLPLSSAEEVFNWAGQTLGDRTRLIPDGETTEERRQWIQHKPFNINPTIERGEDIVYGDIRIPTFRVKEGVEPVFDEPLEYAEWARDSYAVFRQVRDGGQLPASAKFLVALPHSREVVTALAEEDSFDAIYPAFAKRLHASVDEIVDAIPHEDLAVQFDIPTWACSWSGYYDDVSESDRERMLSELADHSKWVPDDVELGFHLCFGDGNQPENVGETRPAEELPADASGITQLSNELVAAIQHPVNFLHLPTYGHWLETERYEPLQGLDVDGTEISLGVINLRRDHGLEAGVAHTRQRAASAREAIGPTFGISSACGLGRYTPEQFAAAGELFNELDQG